MRPDLSVDRRDVLAMAGTSAAAIGTIAGGTMLLGGSAVATAQIDTEDLEVTTPDGTVEEIVVYMEVECSYDNVEGTVQWLGVTTTLDGETIHSAEYDVNHPDWLEADTGPDSGSVVYRPYMDRYGTNDRVFLFEDTAYEPSDFEVTEDGAAETFDLDFGVEMAVITEAEETVATTETSATSQLTITNEADDGGDGGTGDDGGGDSDSEEQSASMAVSQVSLTVELPNGDTVSSS